MVMYYKLVDQTSLVNAISRRIIPWLEYSVSMPYTDPVPDKTLYLAIAWWQHDCRDLITIEQNEIQDMGMKYKND